MDNLDDFEAYNRKLKILETSGPFTPEILPGSLLSMLESDLIRDWGRKAQLKFEIAPPHPPRIWGETRGLSETTSGAVEYLDRIFSKNEDRNINSGWILTLILPEKNTKFSYHGNLFRKAKSNLSIDDFDLGAAVLSYLPASCPNRWENGTVDSPDSLQFEQRYWVERSPIVETDFDTACNLDASDADNQDEDYLRKLTCVLKHGVPCPEILPDTNLSELERWMLKNQDENGPTLFVLPSMNISGTNLRLCTLILELTSGDRIMSILINFKKEIVEAAVHDIMMNSLVLGTQTLNTDKKAVYILRSQRSPYDPQENLVHYDPLQTQSKTVLIVPISTPTMEKRWSESRIRSIKYSHTCSANRWYRTEILDESYLCSDGPEGPVFIDIDGVSHYVYELPHNSGTLEK